MTLSTCPHCGARRTVTADKKRRHFECDTFYFRANSYERGYDCFERQLAAQAAEIERLKTSATMSSIVLKAIHDEREACAVIADGWAEGKQIAAEIRARGEVK